ncbi:MAG: M15 family metallopeptidase [Lachnospiraceae bacterium]|nr:M15 family metallopeptidase [Lachnospiraceae bacterium]
MPTLTKKQSPYFAASTVYEHLTFTEKDITTGNLVLVNREHPICADPPSHELIDINCQQPDLLSPHKGEFQNQLSCLDHPVEEIYLQKQAATMLFSLIKKSGAGGRITAVSGCRSLREQTAIWEETVSGKGLAFTEKYVARPGCSEHQSGLAIDLAKSAPSIDYIRPHLPREGAIAAFMRLAPQFGFILRYPEGKEEITRIGYEPWHFRYVGFPHSVIMTDSQMTLEEYLEMLENGTSPLKPFTYTQDGARIDIIYLSMKNRQKVEAEFSDVLPHTISGTNKSGIVLTRFRRH